MTLVAAAGGGFTASEAETRKQGKNGPVLFFIFVIYWQAALHSSTAARERSASAYSYEREGEPVRIASSVLVTLRGDLEVKSNCIP